MIWNKGRKSKLVSRLSTIGTRAFTDGKDFRTSKKLLAGKAFYNSGTSLPWRHWKEKGGQNGLSSGS